MSNKTSQYSVAIWALIFVAFLNALMGVWSRYLSKDYALFQQVGLRALAGGCFGAAFYFSRTGIKSIVKMSKRDFAFVVLRSVTILVGILLFTYSINKGNFANVNMIFSLPTTALLGFFLLKEKVTTPKVILIALSFVGALLVSVKSFGNFGAFSLAEIAAIISTFFYSFAYITRKWISKEVTSKQIATLGSTITGIAALFFSVIIGDSVHHYVALFSSSIIFVICAGLTYLFVNFFLNYGFEFVDAVTANNILALNFIFGILISIVMYNEYPTIGGIVGGLLIIISAIYINYLEKSDIT